MNLNMWGQSQRTRKRNQSISFWKVAFGVMLSQMLERMPFRCTYKNTCHLCLLRRFGLSESRKYFDCSLTREDFHRKIEIMSIGIDWLQCGRILLYGKYQSFHQSNLKPCYRFHIWNWFYRKHLVLRRALHQLRRSFFYQFYSLMVFPTWLPFVKIKC